MPLLPIPLAAAPPSPTPTPQGMPDVSEVGALLRARTKAAGGTELGTFTANTRPTGAEVQLLISEAADEVLGKVQTPDAGSDYERRVRRTIALYAAMLVELSYFPEQVRSDRSAFTAYERMYDSRIRALIAEGELGKPGGMGEGKGGGSDAPADAAWTFPADAGGLIGWSSRW